LTKVMNSSFERATFSVLILKSFSFLHSLIVIRLEQSNEQLICTIWSFFKWKSWTIRFFGSFIASPFAINFFRFVRHPIRLMTTWSVSSEISFSLRLWIWFDLWWNILETISGFVAFDNPMFSPTDESLDKTFIDLETRLTLFKMVLEPQYSIIFNWISWWRSLKYMIFFSIVLFFFLLR